TQPLVEKLCSEVVRTLRWRRVQCACKRNCTSFLARPSSGPSHSWYREGILRSNLAPKILFWIRLRILGTRINRTPMSKMSTFAVGKSSPNKSDTKNASLAMKSRQQVINEVNKRRTLLQDNSWIKKRPEEENADENYGKVVLNQYKSQDSLHRNTDEKDDQKALLSRYRSDTTLNRISDSSNADKVNKLPILDSRPGNSKGSDTAGISGSDTSPVKKKRQSWMPPPVSSQKPSTDDAEVHKRTPSTSDKSGGPKMIVYSSEPVTSPKPNAAVNDPTRTRQISPGKPSESAADKTATAERRKQDLDNQIEVKAKGDKSDKRKQDLDNQIEVKAKGDKSDKRSQDLDDLIVTKSSTEDQNKKRRQDLDSLIEVKAKGDKSDKRSQDLDDLIVTKSSTEDQNKKRRQDLDSLIEVKAKGDKSDKRSQDLDDLIVTKSSTEDQNKKRRQDLDSLIEVKAKGDKSDKRHQDLDDLIKANGPANGPEKGGRDLDDLISVNNTTQRNRRQWFQFSFLFHAANLPTYSMFCVSCATLYSFKLH
ncbi:hypothetical protein lerEdw1_017026, partial [Lerista edwardsae]